MSKKSNAGAFKKGYDSRRHAFTAEECELGYERALLSISERYPEARCKHGASLAHCFLSSKNPAFAIERAHIKALQKETQKALRLAA